MNETTVDFNEWIKNLTDLDLKKINEWNTTKVTDLTTLGKTLEPSENIK